MAGEIYFHSLLQVECHEVGSGQAGMLWDQGARLRSQLWHLPSIYGGCQI